MLDHLFENRNNTLGKLVILTESLSRSLRENIEIFSIDDTEQKINFVTESGKIISGNYSLEAPITLNNIQVETVDGITDEKQFNSLVETTISDFIGDIYQDEYTDAQIGFESILNLWEQRLKLSNTLTKLKHKTEVFNENQDIINTKTFKSVLEVKSNIIKTLNKISKKLSEDSEFVALANINNQISKAFNLPKIDITLIESFSVPEKITKDFFTILCEQELLAQELKNLKESFSVLLSSNPKAKLLAEQITNNSDEQFKKSLSELISNVPYVALATKKQIRSLLETIYDIEEKDINEEDIKKFVSKIFEAKKNVKEVITGILKEKYKINVNDLKTVVSFHYLNENNREILSAILDLFEETSTTYIVLSDFISSLEEKNGIQVIDVNDFIQDLLTESGVLNEKNTFKISEVVDFGELMDSKLTLEQILKLISDAQEEDFDPEELEKKGKNKEKDEEDEEEKKGE